MQQQAHKGVVDPAPEGARLVGDLFETHTAPGHPGAVALHSLWSGLFAAGRPPPREAFSMERIGALGLLGRFFVIEPLQGGLDWRYRLLGSRLSWLFGRDITNIPFRDHYDPKKAAHRIALSNGVLRSRAPVFLRARFIAKGLPGELETLSLPVVDPCGDGFWLVGASFAEGEAARRAGR